MTSVLHIYPKTDSMIANYVTMLTQAMGEQVCSFTADDQKEAQLIMNREHPDIVHLHGHPTWTVSDGDGHSRLVVTPHGQPVGALRPYVVIARSALEQRQLAAWPRVETVRNPLITKTVKVDDCAQSVMRIYQKVMDSDVLPFFSDDTRRTLQLLLKVGLCGDSRWIGDEQLPDQTQWRLLYIYAYHEGITRMLDQGMTLMGRQIPPRTNPVSYLPENYVKPQRRPKARVCELTAEVQRQLRDGRLELLLLCDLHQALRRDSVDDDKLMDELKQQKLNLLFPSILQILKNTFLLDEGFMPCAPCDNRTTAQLQSSLNNHLKL